ncbi:cupin domain-containing protein [Kiritimatiellaeota bacterium B1221]|nr:cupin domain-containing protein [Kiritimatiellaeota bacterium B1221]
MLENTNKPLVRYLDETDNISCPYGQVKRIITGGEFPGANVHVVTVSRGGEHYHPAYTEVYYVLSGTGKITLGGQIHVLRPGAVVVIPAGTVHSLASDTDEDLTFIIFGMPGMSIDAPEAHPQKPERTKV